MTETLTQPNIRVAPSRVAAVGERLVSLDAYRGFVMLLMASEGLGIVETWRNIPAGSSWKPFWRVLASQFDHVQWTGCGLWDLIQPSFMFIVGVALPFSLAKRRSNGESFGRMLLHAVWRSLVLIALGIFLRSIGRMRPNFTFEDVLTQIGLGYTFLFLLAWTRPRVQWIAAIALLVGYWLAFALYPTTGMIDPALTGVTPQWHALHGLHGFAAHWDKNTNFGARFDLWFLNLFPRPRPFTHNDGGYLTLSFIPSLATMIFGLLCGGLLRSRRSPSGKIVMLIAFGILGLLVGSVLDATGICPVVKRIWTPSWAIYAGGWTCLLLAAFYAVIDRAKYRRWAFPLVVVGMNSIAMYCMADSPFRAFVRETLQMIFGRGYLHFTGHFAPLAEAALVLLVLWLICLWMYRRRIFLRI